ncbi:hypothetical protein MRX96_005549 [Rhipicephalus microplus]
MARPIWLAALGSASSTARDCGYGLVILARVSPHCSPDGWRRLCADRPCQTRALARRPLVHVLGHQAGAPTQKPPKSNRTIQLQEMGQPKRAGIGASLDSLSDEHQSHITEHPAVSNPGFINALWPELFVYRCKRISCMDSAGFRES